MSQPSRKSRGQLIVPSAYRPWSVEVCSAVPRSLRNLSNEGEPRKKKKRLTTVLDSSLFNSGAVCPGWACLSTATGSVYVWPTNKENSNSGGSLTASPAAKKAVMDPLDAAVALYHPDIVAPPNVEPNTSSKPLMALARVHPSSSEAVFVYVCQPATGALLAWKVTQADAKKAGLKSPSQYASTFLPLDRQDDDEDVFENEDTNHREYPDEVVVSLSVIDRQMLVFGTSTGGMISCSVSTIPVALHAQRLIPAKSRKSFGAFLWGGSSDEDVIRDGAPVKFSLPLPALNDDDKESAALLAISELGTIWHWRIIPTVAKNHSVTSKVSYCTSLVELFHGNLSPSIENLNYAQPLQSTLLENRLHVIVRITEANDGECRLYWLRLRVEREGSKVNIAWVDAQWLNRFPAPQDIISMGLVLCANDWAYAAFHQRSGGVTSSVIVMALSDSDRGNDGGEPSSAVYEVDLPMTEAPQLLPDTFTNDIETHGCCVFARSGLGLRVRILPPEAPSASLSPRAAARANPTSVLKLAQHLRSAFLEAYQHQDGSAGSLKLPPSLEQANTVDLEEAVIAVATELHTRRGNDATSVALLSNGLEWHLALIQWLRQVGLYRSLSSFAKWRLLALGQEVVAFQELVTPTMSPKSSNWEKEQFSNLNLAQGIAVWLKEKLQLVLRDGSIEEYQLFCGWFSTALASATTYRDERATDTYDITLIDKPPMIGESMDEESDGKATRVPWTSHRVLQDCFALLLQHWLQKPKHKSVQILPHQTLAVITKAALDSFSDSSKSLNTERAIGKYAEIKAMAIPLLLSTCRAGERGDDKLAFKLSVKHDYYEGICQIANDHANKPDSDSFRLEPLLQSTTQCQTRDFQSGCTFGQFVLQYHAQRGLYGHTILYGRLCPEGDLNDVMQSDESLRSHQWIQFLHKGLYDEAVKSLMDRAENRPLTQSKWSFAMAKLANQVLLKETHPAQTRAVARQKKIEAKLELAGIQKELLDDSAGSSKSHSDQHLWSPKNLLSLALEKAEKAAGETEGSSTRDAVTRYCYLALLVCTTYDTEAVQRNNAILVWSKAISLDWDSWSEWIRTEHDLSRDALAYTVIDNTVFGGLLQECEDEPHLESVTFSSQFMEQPIVEQLGLAGGSGVDSFRRFLFNVTKVFKESGSQDQEMEDVMG